MYTYICVMTLLCLPKSFFVFRLSMSVQIMMIVAIFISYGLHCYVPCEVLWRGYVNPRLLKAGITKTTAYNYIFRVVLCLFTCKFIVLYIE